jgi:large subunit ribosomal protein L25
MRIGTSAAARCFFLFDGTGAIMADMAVLKLSKREGRGSRTAGKLRKTGQAPGVVYGHKQATISVSVSAEELVSAIRHGARVVDLQLDGGTEKAQIAEVQWDHLGQEIVHVDFRRVSADERIHLTVPIELRGIAPGIAAGGVLDQPLHALEIECPAIHVPDSIRVNINELQLGAAIHVRELNLPPDVKALSDPDAVVVHVTAPQVEEEPGAEPMAGTAEPEIVGRRVAAEEAEAE